MQLQLQNIGKHYQYQWVFRGIDLAINTGEKYALKGQNGSGKSTLLKICCGIEKMDEGILLFNDSKDISEKHFSFCAPYTSPIMDFSTLENIAFAGQFKPWRSGLTTMEIAQLLPENKRHFEKPLHLLSSGMIQRVKLLLCMMAEVPLVCLDEPLTNLDKEGMQWFDNLGRTYLQQSTVLVAGNDAAEFSFCEKEIDLVEKSILIE